MSTSGSSHENLFGMLWGMVASGDTAADLALAGELGLGACRFTMSWPQASLAGGLDTYDRFVDELLDAGLRPVPALGPWDLPADVADEGGWSARDTAERYADQVGHVARRLGDRAGSWVTVDGPALGAPWSWSENMSVAHHLLVAHGLAVRALRAAGVTDVGIVDVRGPVGSDDVVLDRLFADPVLLGSYPEEVTDRLPAWALADLGIVSEPVDWYGVGRRPGPAGSLTGLVAGLVERYGDVLPPVVGTEDLAGEGGLAAHGRAVEEALAAGVNVRAWYVRGQ